MSLHDSRMKHQLKENQDIYYAWVEECERLGDPSPLSMKDYKSTVTEFFEKCVVTSILDVDFETIENFINAPELKLSRRTAKLDYLKHFLSFTERKNKVRWDFEVGDLMVIKPDAKATRESVERAEPLTARELIRLYEFFNNHISEQKWLESYVVFRLMYNYKLDKFEIAKINGNTLSVSTGEFRLVGFPSPVMFDEEIKDIFKSNGPNFLPSNAHDVYSRLTDLSQILSVDGHKRKVTQKVIDKTRDRFKILCPECGDFIENDPRLFGYVQVDILNLGSLLLCKNCLENSK